MSELLEVYQPGVLPEEPEDDSDFVALLDQVFGGDDEVKHMGPGPHPSGSPQSVHGRLTPVGMSDRTIGYGGLTLQVARNIYPDGGYALALYPERERPFTLEEFKQDPEGHLQKFLDDNADLLSQEENHLGTWRDYETDRVVLDVSVVLYDRAEAIARAKEQDEDAIYDLSTFDPIYMEDEE